MRREIKFRAYDVQLKEMHSWENIKRGLFCSPWDLFFCETDDKVLMQYTGLKDKNGKEIYEWDIIRMRDICTNPKHNDVGVHDEIFQVVFHNAKFQLLDIGNSIIVDLLSGDDDDDTCNSTFEVIGNLFDSSKLLESLKQINSN